MNTRERDVMRRLVEDVHTYGLIAEADSLLSESSEGPVAEGYAVFFQQADGSWGVSVSGDAEDFDDPSGALPCRLPVPAHLVNPPVVEGEVVP